MAIFALLRRKRVSLLSTPTAETYTDLLRPEPAAALLGTLRRQRLLEQIWQRTSVSRAQFDLLYRAPIERYAALVQQFPASESHHHAYPGGMLDHGLESVAYALRLRQSHLLPAGAPPETQAAQAEAWTAGAAYGALLHDLGKIAVDLHVEYANGTRWHPWHGPLRHPYRFRYVSDREYRLHSVAAGLLYTDILDSAILDWLSGFRELWAALLHLLAGRYEHAGVLGELVLQADRASTAAALGGDPQKVRTSPTHALHRQLLDGLRFLVREQLKLNRSEASDGWLTADSLWLVSKTVCDKLRAHLLSQGIDGIPSTNTAVFDVLQEHGIVQATPDGKAIWRATVTSGNGWTHSFTFLRIAPALIWDMNERPASFAGSVHVEEAVATSLLEAPATASASPTSSSAAVASATDMSTAPEVTASDSVDHKAAASPNVHTEGVHAQTYRVATDTKPTHMLRPAPPPVEARSQHAPSVAPDEPIGLQFVSWLRESIQAHRLIINDAKALVHTVAGTAFLVSPGVFQRYTQEHPEIARLAKQSGVAEWAWVQKQFEKLRLHRRQDNGLNIWMCEVAGPRKTRRLHGYLLLDGHTLFSDMPCDNPYLRLLTSAPKRNAA
ncbi:MAG: helicase/relaxase domain-containing protein [Steroidobacteraceae bacterium]|nr:helicase/relaxase domain-containing protein [Steroidobacteraceae bacterium]